MVWLGALSLINPVHGTLILPNSLLELSDSLLR